MVIGDLSDWRFSIEGVSKGEREALKMAKKRQKTQKNLKK